MALVAFLEPLVVAMVGFVGAGQGLPMVAFRLGYGAGAALGLAPVVTPSVGRRVIVLA